MKGVPGEKPCEGAFLDDYVMVDARIFEEPPEHLHDEWWSRGKNHRVVNGYAERDLDDLGQRWFVEVDSVESLVELTKLVDARIIVGAGPTLEIYDDYH